jgi:DNA-binding CsgD family transcriptional regulator
LCLAALAADERLQAINSAQIAEDIGLTPRERECLEWLCQGLRNDAIAERMRIARPTVELHLAKARKKLRAATREQALAKALTLGLISP